MKEFKCRASALGKLMTNDRSGKNMGETAKTLVRETWIKNTFGREQIVTSKYMTKGIECEEDSLSLYTSVTGKLVTKNESNLFNEYLTGTPDAFNRDKVIDIKTSWDLFTFAKSELTSDYEWQLRAYMWLLNLPKAELAYCLVDTPNDMISDELYKLQFAFVGGDSNPAYDEAKEQTKKNMMFSDIAPELRLKTFDIERDFEIEEQIKERVELARKYYAELKL